MVDEELVVGVADEELAVGAVDEELFDKESALTDDVNVPKVNIANITNDNEKKFI